MLGQGGAAALAYYIAYNGTTAVLDCGSAASLDNLHDNAFTAEAWINIASGGENAGGRILDKIGWIFFVRTISGAVYISSFIDCATTDAQVTSKYDLLLGEWLHVAVTWDDATFTVPKLWVMGNLVDTQMVTNRSGAIVSDAASNLCIGNRVAADRTFDGSIGWSRVSNNLRYTAPFDPPARCTPPATDANTVLLLRQTEGTGTAVADSSGNGNNGTLSNGSWTLQTCAADALVAASASLIKGSGQWAYTAARLSHQRSCWYAQGRYWLLYGNYNGDNGPYDLYYASSVDGVTFTSTLLSTFPYADAEWALCYDDARNKLHIVKNIQGGNGLTIPHDGLSYRRGTPNSDGSITWDAAWQTVVAVGTNVGDFSLDVDSNGFAWVAYCNSSSGDGSTGSAIVRRNSASDGTWSLASGFPATIKTGVSDDAFAVLAALGDGTMFAVSYEWAIDAKAKGYVIAADGTVTSDGDATVSNVEAAIPFVGAIEVASKRDGDIHLVYQDTSQNIKYRKRTAGSWGSETTLSNSSRVSAPVSSPRLSFGDTGKILVTWLRPHRTYLATYSGSSWGTPVVAIEAAIQDHYEHTMPSLLTNGSKLQVVTLLSDFTLKHYLLDV